MFNNQCSIKYRSTYWLHLFRKQAKNIIHCISIENWILNIDYFQCSIVNVQQNTLVPWTLCLVPWTLYLVPWTLCLYFICFFLWCKCLCLCLCLCLSYLPFLPGPSFCAGLIPLWSTFCGSVFVILWPKLKLQMANPRARNSIIFFIVAKFKIVIGNIAGVYFSIDMPMNQIVVNCSLFTNLRKRKVGNCSVLSLSGNIVSFGGWQMCMIKKRGAIIWAGYGAAIPNRSCWCESFCMHKVFVTALM